MSIHELLIVQIAAALALVAIGLCVRRRVGFCQSFFVYVLITGLSISIEAGSDAFKDYGVYSMKETALAILKMLIGLEIWYRTFSSFPRARTRLGITLVIVLGFTALAVLAIPIGLYPYDALIGVLHPRQQAGTLALYAIVASAASWYRVPLHPLHRAILIGFAGYLSISAIAASYLGSQEGNATVYRVGDWLQLATYSAATVWWAWAAWRPVRAPSPIIARLQPWAHSW